MLWWIIFFSLLPIDVKREKSKTVYGEDPGSPENPKILKKACYTTLITTFIFTIIYLMVKYDYLNLRNLLT
tara:strand:- start:371 stop:583 length:213 start_codon:yes stop_codon:yes gene_type:complete